MGDDLPRWLAAVLEPGSRPVRADDDIWSTCSPAMPTPRYDGRARLYDRLIGSTIYNRVAWGTSPAAYTAFASRAAAAGDGVFLDAGCGTLVSTVAVYARANRPMVLVDLSIDMLRVARDRLVTACGRLPGSVVLLQADIRHLPFRPGGFGSILCPGMLHLFDDVEAIAAALARTASPGASLYMTSLVSDRWLSARYLDALHRTGEIAAPRDTAGLLRRLNSDRAGLAGAATAVTEGGMAFVTAPIAGAAA